MLFNKDYCFIHLHKTGGTSFYKFLSNNLEAPLYSIGKSNSNFNYLSILPWEIGNVPGDRPDLIYLNGDKHAPIYVALDAMQFYGVNPWLLKAIFVIVRNPYALTVSLYHFQKRAGDLPEGLTFSDWVKANKIHNFRLPYRYDGYLECPINDLQYLVHVLRQETLDEDINAVADKFGLTRPIQPLRENTNPHPEWTSFITPELEVLIYNEYRYLFEAGLYTRLSL